MTAQRVEAGATVLYKRVGEKRRKRYVVQSVRGEYVELYYTSTMARGGGAVSRTFHVPMNRVELVTNEPQSALARLFAERAAKMTVVHNTV